MVPGIALSMVYFCPFTRSVMEVGFSRYYHYALIIIKSASREIMPDVVYIVFCNICLVIFPGTPDGQVFCDLSVFGIPSAESIGASHIVPLVISGYGVIFAILGIYCVILVVFIGSAICRQCLGVIACRHVSDHS